MPEPDANPSFESTVAIAQALEVSVEYLVTGKEKTDVKITKQHLSAEMRSIKDCVEPLSRENRKIIENTVTELARLLCRPMKDEPVALTPLQKVFLRLFR